MSYIASIIKSLQVVVATNPGNTTTVQVALSPAVNPDTSIIIPLGVNQGTSGGLFSPFGFARWDLIASGTVLQTLTGVVSGGTGGYARAQVIEFYGNLVKSAGRGSMSFPANVPTVDVTVPAVVLAKTLLVMTGQYFSGANARLGGNLGDDNEQIISADLQWLNATTIRGTWTRNPNWPGGNHLPNRNVGYNYLEFR